MDGVRGKMVCHGVKWFASKGARCCRGTDGDAVECVPTNNSRMRQTAPLKAFGVVGQAGRLPCAGVADPVKIIA